MSEEHEFEFLDDITADNFVLENSYKKEEEKKEVKEEVKEPIKVDNIRPYLEACCPIYHSMNEDISDLVDEKSYCPIRVHVFPNNTKKTRFYVVQDILDKLPLLQGNFFANFYDYIPKYTNCSSDSKTSVLFMVPAKYTQVQDVSFFFGAYMKDEFEYYNLFLPCILQNTGANNIRKMAKLAQKCIISMNSLAYSELDNNKVPYFTGVDIHNKFPEGYTWTFLTKPYYFRNIKFNLY